MNRPLLDDSSDFGFFVLRNERLVLSGNLNEGEGKPRDCCLSIGALREAEPETRCGSRIPRRVNLDDGESQCKDTCISTW